MSDILRLPSLKVISVKCKDKFYINAETIKKPSLCPCCSAISPRLQIQAHKRQIFHDLRIHGKMVGILVDRKRYLCVECGKTFMEPLPDLDEKRSLGFIVKSKRWEKIRFIQSRRNAFRE